MVNCWEFKKCGPKTYAVCPAYPSDGKKCWKKTGKKCGSGHLEKASLAEKIEFCRVCEFYVSFAEKF